MSELIISKSSFFSNLSILQDNINTKIAAVIKDNAYGHGIKEISKLLVEFGIADVFVRNNAEARLVCDKFNSVGVLYPNCYENIANNVFLSVANIESIQKIPSFSNIELKINTGMNRNGIDVCDVEAALELVLSRHLHLVGVFTHNAYGDSADDKLCEDFIAQHNLFGEIKKQCVDFATRHGIPIPRFHSLSSSGALKALGVNNVTKDEVLKDDLVRIGIAMYGYLGCTHSIAKKLKPIAELWANKISTHKLPKGAKIGYEGASVLEEDCIVSSYDIGYGDGLFRLNESHNLQTKEGYVILPRMSMDSTSIISSKDKVCIMHDANKIARLFHTIPYEVLCKISPFIKRVVKE